MELIQCFPFPPGSVVSLIGSGGKTTLMNFLANGYRKQRVLMSTTTKINFPAQKDFDFFYSSVQGIGFGITLFGALIEGGRKLKSPPLAALRRVIPLFDIAFLEADGSKSMPLKGWADIEPVVVNETTDTLGIIPITACGKRVNGTTVHRLPIFLSYGFKENQLITPEVLAQVIMHPRGLFREAKGKKWLVLSQANSEQELALARQVVDCLNQDSLTELTAVIAADVLTNKGWVLWKN